MLQYQIINTNKNFYNKIEHANISISDILQAYNIKKQKKSKEILLKDTTYVISLLIQHIKPNKYTLEIKNVQKHNLFKGYILT